MTIQFIPSVDKKTKEIDNRCINLVVDGNLIREEIPYLPRLLVDQRHVALFFWMREQGIHNRFEDLEFENEKTQEEVSKGFTFLLNQYS